MLVQVAYHPALSTHCSLAVEAQTGSTHQIAPDRISPSMSVPVGVKDPLHLTRLSVTHYQPLFKSALLKVFYFSVSHSTAQVCMWISSTVSSGLIPCHGISQARGASIYSQIFPILKPENSNSVLVKAVDKTILL